MGQIIQTNGDYNIKTYEGGTIKLDTGPNVGRVVVTGDIVIGGTTTRVEADNLTIKDNIIIVNDGETGDGVTLQYSGLQVDRGTDERVNLLWDELMVPPVTIPAGDPGGWQLVAGTEGFYNFANSRLKLKEILTDSGTDAGDLTLIGTGTGVIKVIGTDTYENQVTHDDDIPNKKYVDDSIQNNPTFQILKEDTRVIVADKETASGPGSLAYLTATTGWSTFGESAVSIIVDGVLVSQFYNDRVLVGDPGVNGIEIDGTNFEIRTEASISDQNILIKTVGTGKLQTNYAVQLEQISTTPAYVSNSSLLFAADPSIGTTGVYFVNDSTEAIKRTGELISKNKALLFSMIF